MHDSTLRWFGGLILAGVLLGLSYLFSLQDGSGSVPVILLFAGLLVAFLVLVVGFTGVGESG